MTILFSEQDLGLAPYPMRPPTQKKLILGCTHTFQIQLDGKEIGQSASRARYKDLAEKMPLFVSVQTTLSSTSPRTLFPWRHPKNNSASSISQSFRALEKQGFHIKYDNLKGLNE